MQDLIVVHVTNKQTDVKSVVEWNGSYYKVIRSEKGGLDVGMTYSGEYFMGLMEEFITEVEVV